MLEECDLLLEFCGVVVEVVRLDDVLAIGTSFDVVEFLSFYIKDYFCGVVEEDTCCTVGEDIS